MTILIYTIKMGGCAVRAKYCEGVGQMGVGGVGFREVGGRRSNFRWVEDGNGRDIKQVGGDVGGDGGTERTLVQLAL